MKYIKEDLDYIYIRVQKPDGEWANFNLNQVTDEQFIEWAERTFNVEAKTSKGTPWYSKQKIHFLNNMNDKLGKPCVVMLRREARNGSDKK